MLTFRSLELEDKDLINSYLINQNYRVSDLCFVNLYAWEKKFNTQFAVCEDWLFIRFKDNYGRNSYLKPIGEGDIKKGIELIIEDHKQFIQYFRSGVTKI